MTTGDQHRDDVKRALSDPWRLAELLGLTEGAKRQASGLSIRCPSHGEKNPSCSVTRAEDGGIRVRCFACDFSGDALSLVAVARGLDVARDFPAVLAEAAKLAGIDAPTAGQRPHLRPVPAPAAPVQDLSPEWAALREIEPDAWDYLRDRNLDDAAGRCRAAPTSGALAAASPGIAVAMRDPGGRVVAIQARNLLTGADHDFRVLGSPNRGLFGQPERVAGSRTIVVCEGLTDTLAAELGFAKATQTAVVGVAGAQLLEPLSAIAWADKHVLIATDADRAGDQAAQAIAELVGRGQGRPIRLRPVGQKDLAAMHEAGVDLLAWARTAASRSIGFRTFGERIEGERERRMADAGKALSYGVKYLDLVTGGIVPRDVVLIGAESGMGKTELVTLLAMTTAVAGKRVHYFALEPEPDEIERRIKFKHLAQLVARSTHGAHLSFQDWQQGKLEHLAGPHDAEANQILAERYRTLHTFYRQERRGPFTAEDFERMARLITDETDVIILDHVHYFDEGEDPNRAQKRVAMRLRDIAIQTGRPLIEVAHLRKKPSQIRKAARLVPERDDFEGSSHLFKPAKRAILLAPAFHEKRSVPWVWPTYLALVKNTSDSIRCRYVGLVGFNARQNSYEETFQLGQLVKNGEKFEPVAPPDLPYWADQQLEMPEATT